MGLDGGQPSQDFGPIIAGCNAILHTKIVGVVGKRGRIMIFGVGGINETAIMIVKGSGIRAKIISLGIRIMGGLSDGASILRRFSVPRASGYR